MDLAVDQPVVGDRIDRAVFQIKLGQLASLLSPVQIRRRRRILRRSDIGRDIRRDIASEAITIIGSISSGVAAEPPAPEGIAAWPPERVESISRPKAKKGSTEKDREWNNWE